MSFSVLFDLIDFADPCFPFSWNPPGGLKGDENLDHDEGNKGGNGGNGITGQRKTGRSYSHGC